MASRRRVGGLVLEVQMGRLEREVRGQQSRESWGSQGRACLEGAVCNSQDGVPLAPPTPSPSSHPTGAGRVHLRLRRSLSQRQHAYGQPVGEPRQPWAGGGRDHAEPFPVELGGSHSPEDLDSPQTSKKT